jgi:acid phosphatase type 7
MMDIKLILFIMMALFCSSVVAQDIIPERVILNITDAPESKVAVSWRTINKLNEPIAQVAEATDWIEFMDSLTTINADIIEFTTDKGDDVFHYSVVFKDLKPSTEYIYRVGSDAAFTEWCQFKTADSKPEPFQFIYFGDSQNQNKEHVSRVFRKAFQTAPNSAFWLLAGDLINDPEDSEVEEFFYAGTPFFKQMPIALATGNHDRKYKQENGKFVRDEKGNKIRLPEIDPYWYASFTFPRNGIEGLEETSYYFDYQGVRFIVINSSYQLDEQAKWLEDILSKNNNNWTIVTFHHPIYSAGRDRDNDETRNAFLPTFDKYNVDLVLTGHDHAYARSHKLREGKKVEANGKGTVYVVSVSGPKMYSVNSNYNHLMGKTGGYTQLFQVINIDQNMLTFKSYTATGKEYDSFELVKQN